MVSVLLNHRDALEADAADALAVALCHAHTQPLNERLNSARRMIAGMRR
jgi:Holliday junction resolvasome RuvABC endonuclease subunit